MVVGANVWYKFTETPQVSFILFIHNIIHFMTIFKGGVWGGVGVLVGIILPLSQSYHQTRFEKIKKYEIFWC